MDTYCYEARDQDYRHPDPHMPPAAQDVSQEVPSGVMDMHDVDFRHDHGGAFHGVHHNVDQGLFPSAVPPNESDFPAGSAVSGHHPVAGLGRHQKNLPVPDHLISAFGMLSNNSCYFPTQSMHYRFSVHVSVIS